jgi:hypothetical protein
VLYPLFTFPLPPLSRLSSYCRHTIVSISVSFRYVKLEEAVDTSAVRIVVPSILAKRKK